MFHLPYLIIVSSSDPLWDKILNNKVINGAFFYKAHASEENYENVVPMLYPSKNKKAFNLLKAFVY